MSRVGRTSATGRGLLQRASLVGVGAAIFVMLAVLAVSSDYSSFLQSPRDTSTQRPSGAVTRAPVFTGRTASQPPDQGTVGDQSHLIRNIVWVLIIAFIVIGALILVTAAVRAIRRIRLSRRRARPHSTIEAIPEAIEEVTDAVHSTRESIQLGTPRNAIVQAWISLEEAVERAGVALHPSETTAELVLRVIDQLNADSSALRRLSTLYRRARFSSHEITEDDRERARRALEALDRSLARHTPRTPS